VARILRLADAPHARSEVLLPWYVNGTLDPDERSLVEAHLAECERCRADLMRLRAISNEVRAIDVDPDRDLALSRLGARLAFTDAPSPEAASAARPGSPAAGRPGRARGRITALWNDAHALRLLVVLQVGVLAALAVIGLRPGQDAGYRTLAAASATARGRLIVAFDGRQPEAAMRRVLVAAAARVVDGPTAGGLYVIEVDTARAAAVAEQLRTSAAVVRVDLATPTP